MWVCVYLEGGGWVVKGVYNYVSLFVKIGSCVVDSLLNLIALNISYIYWD